MSHKQQYCDSNIAHRITQIQFGLFSKEQIERQAHIEVNTAQIYTGVDEGNKLPMSHGVLDLRMGLSKLKGECDTCGHNLQDCIGHYGYVELALPVFHSGFFRFVAQMVQLVCKICSKLLLKTDEIKYYISKLKKIANSPVARRALSKQILSNARKYSLCPHCLAPNGIVRNLKKYGFMKLVHNPYRPSGKKFSQTDHALFIENFADAIEHNSELDRNLNKAMDLLNPLKVLNIFKNVSNEDCIILGMTPGNGRPEDLICERILVPPPCIRPSVQTDSGGTNEDDITIKLADIVKVNNILRQFMNKGEPSHRLMDIWDSLQIHCAMLINSSVTLPPHVQIPKLRRSFIHRLKGKQGRFRGNLSGKRVDFSGRTVISPDPNLRVDEVAVPIEIAKTMTYPERVHKANIKRMRQLIINGPDKHPGANYLIPKIYNKQSSQQQTKIYLRYANKQREARDLKYGDVVERHMLNGDLVLFNRQPSLHKLSIMTHFVKVIPNRTFSFNECVCTPYNADFDGDEMNLHLPQTEEAKAEALSLMGVASNLVTPRNGEPLISAIQDFITGSYLLTHKDEFFDRPHFTQLVSSFLKQDDSDLKIIIPTPAIIKPYPLWTGKQVFTVLLKPNEDEVERVNIRAPGKQYTQNEELCTNDSYLVVHNSELLAGSLDKSMIGTGSKTNIFYIFLRDYSAKSAVACMTRMARLIPFYLSNRGFSIGIGDVWPGEALVNEKKKLVEQGYNNCTNYIHEYRDGKLQSQPGCTIEETLEVVIIKELSEIRDHAGKACKRELHPTNAPLIMALSGAKGSFVNISQMIACVGQQVIGNKRIPNGFTDRTLPHFMTKSKQPNAKGFVQNSFFSGMTPTEFYFHTIGGREGLVDTAVKTAETGYMQRRLVKSLEDICVQYDSTVRDSSGTIIQFKYGGDGIDPVMVEAENTLLDFDRILYHVKQLNSDSSKPSVSTQTIRNAISKLKTESKFAQCDQETILNLKEFLEDKAAILEKMDYSDSHLINLKKEYLNNDHLKSFIDLCYNKIIGANIDPGTAVGALAAQSIGEPATQMTLKTFHFAGVASMNITQGVPRIKEIINATKSISTPIIDTELADNTNEEIARIVKGRIEKTLLSEITKSINEVYRKDTQYLRLELDLDRIKLLKLEVDVHKVKRKLYSASGLKVKEFEVNIQSKSTLHIFPLPPYKQPVNFLFMSIKNKILKLVIQGLSTVSRVIINQEENKSEDGNPIYKLYVEGQNLRAVMATIGVDGTKTKSNNMIEVEKALGIEAARKVIIDQIFITMKNHGMQLDNRHVMLLADFMTCKGEVHGITRFGIHKMKDSVLMLASFEKTTDHLFEAALHSQIDSINGVSECIIMGLPMKLGTGMFKLLYNLPKPQFTRRKLLFANPEFHIDELITA